MKTSSLRLQLARSSLRSPRRTFERRAGAFLRACPVPLLRPLGKSLIQFSSVSWLACEVLGSSAAWQLSNSAACKHFHSLLRSLLLSLSSSVPCTFKCKILNYDGSCFSIKGASRKKNKKIAASDWEREQAALNLCHWQQLELILVMHECRNARQLQNGLHLAPGESLKNGRVLPFFTLVYIN